MRRTAHCLILLLAPVAAHAAEAIDTPARSGCTYAPGEVERVAAPAASVSLANAVPPSQPKHTVPAPQQAGGGSDEDALGARRCVRGLPVFVWHVGRHYAS